MNNDYVAPIKTHGDGIALIRWNRQSNCFTLECNDYVVIYKEAINDFISELEKLQELMNEKDEIAKPKKKH